MKPVATRFLLPLAMLLLSSCSLGDHGFLVPSGPIADAQRDSFLTTTAWTLVVIVPLFIATPIVLWKYRFGKKDATYRPEWTFSWGLELLIWGLPLVIVSVLSWNFWTASHELDPYAPIPSDKPALHIQVVGLNWKWLFIYPDQHVASVDKVVFPVNRPIRFEMTSGTVMQSFMIPRLGSQVYTMPGMRSQLNLLASQPGSYKGQNTQYTGESYAKQKFRAEAVSPSEFRHWIKQQHSRPPLDMNAYNRLAQRSVLSEPEFFGSVSPDLFSQILTRVKTTPAADLPGAAKATSQGG